MPIAVERYKPPPPQRWRIPITVTIPKDRLEQIDREIKRRGLMNRSRLIDRLLQDFLEQLPEE